MAKSDASAPRIKWLVEPTFDDDGVQRTAGIDQFGREHGDPTPLNPPVGLSVEQGDETHALLKRMFAAERARYQAMIEAEQFENEDEANDFICEEELFPPGNERWEDIFEFPAEPSGSVANEPSLASGSVQGGAAQQDAVPPVAPSRQITSGGFGPDVTPGTPPTGMQKSVSDSVVSGDNRKVGEVARSTPVERR